MVGPLVLHRPAFDPAYLVQPVDPDGVLLLAEDGHILLRGAVYRHLAPLIDGRHTTDDLIDLTRERLSAAEVYYALMRLEGKGYIAEADDSLPAAAAAFWSATGVGSGAAARRLGSARVAVAGLGEGGDQAASLLAEALAMLDVPAGAYACADLLLVAVDDYLQDGLARLNAEAIAAARPWLPVKPAGRTIWVGPLFRPGQTGCWECLAQRLRLHRQVEAFVQEQTGQAQPPALPRAALPTTLRVAAHLAATLAARAVAGGEPGPLDGRLLTLDLISLETRRHTLVRRPQCPACGDPANPGPRSPAPLVLASRPKRFTADGGHRSATPQETLRRYGHHISPITGVVTMLRRTSGEGDSVMHTYLAGQNLAARHERVASLRQHLRSQSGGKGATDVQARASGLGEAIERYCGLYQGDEPQRRATITDLGPDAIHPAACLLFSARQYRNRAAWNARGLPFHTIPGPFDEARPLDWTPLWSLTHQTLKYVPTAYCYYGYPQAPADAVCWADSNGNAAGNTLEEAILQGLLELVERDAVALWWYNRLRRPAVDLDSLDDPYVQQLCRAYQARGRDLWALDLTSDLGVPVAAAITRRIDHTAGGAEEILFGFGAHLDPRLAILRALSEANQVVAFAQPPYADGGSNGVEFAPEIREWLRTATLAAQPYLAPAEVAPRRLEDFRDHWSDDVRDDVRTCQAVLERQGMEVLVLDQTRPDVGMPVVKVVVPGLRHFWARFAPGRLYDVPVKLGWLPAPLPEADLNPTPMFL
jgi:ribosomal protein S12 methylthiotransferase accessory factor